MGYYFPREHERRISFDRDEVAAAPTSGERRRSRPSFAEIDLVEANLERDARAEREDGAADR